MNLLCVWKCCIITTFSNLLAPFPGISFNACVEFQVCAAGWFGCVTFSAWSCRERKRETETDRDRQRQTDKQSDRHRNRETETDRETERNKDTDRQTDHRRAVNKAGDRQMCTKPSTGAGNETKQADRYAVKTLETDVQ